MKIKYVLIVLFAILLINQSCYRIMPSKGGGQLDDVPEKRNIEPTDVLLPDGYKIEVVTEGLTFPTAVTFDEEGNTYVIEGGYSYGEVFLAPKLLKIQPDGSTTTVYTGQKNGPWTGITYSKGYFYIAEGGQVEGGKILKISNEGTTQVLVEGLPSLGDHHTNGPVIRDGYLYFGQGTATNSGIVGNDNASFGWLYRFPDFHDIPCKDITINAINSETKNVLSDNPDDKAVTGPFLPYNQKAEPNEVIKGALPCTGAVMRVPINGGDLELVAWGFRNPYGLALAPDGQIYVTNNSYDVRGSRPVWGTGDLLFKLEQDAWYGWPDYNGSIAITHLEIPGEEDPKKILVSDPGTPPEPVASLGVHSSSNGISFSTNGEFGFEGQAFIAQFGDMAPGVGKVLSPVGYRVVRVDVDSGIIEDFATNRAKKNGPASWLETGGLERPVSVQFSPDGSALYITDFGILATSKKGANPVKNSGVVWKITRQD